MNVTISMKEVHQVYENENIHKELAKEYEVSNTVIRRNTLLRAINLIKFVKQQRQDAGFKDHIGFDMSIDILRGMLDD